MTQYLHLTAAATNPHAREVYVSARDGVRLATDVYLPGPPPNTHADTRVEPGDTILVRLPYDKNGSYTFMPLIAAYFMARDYRVVVQDVRGKFRSEGQTLLFVNEAHDGEDTIAWIVQQPWSNGRVAMWGDSYYGYTQWAAAASGHPALKAIAPRLTGTRLGEPVPRDPSTRTAAIEQAITYLYPLTHFHGRDSYLWQPDWSRRDFADQAEAFLARIGQRSHSYDQWVPHPVPLPRFPAGSPFHGRSVPALHTVGWWDNCAPLAWADITEIQQHPNWAAHHYLRIESIDHEGYQLCEDEGDRVADRNDAQLHALLPRTLDPALDFFEVFVRGRGSPENIPRVVWQLADPAATQPEHMRVSNRWPPQETRTETLSATSDGRLIAHNTAQLSDAEESTELSWLHDPNNLVPSSVPDAFAYLLYLPDEAPLGDRDDVLVFTSAASTREVELVGPASARLQLRSTGPVLDCFVRLLDLAPDGTALRIARGQLQLRDAQQAETVDIDLGQLGYRLRLGHRLRVHLSSSDYPEFLPQPGTGADPWSGGSVSCSNQNFLTIGAEAGFTLTLSVLKGSLL